MIWAYTTYASVLARGERIPGSFWFTELQLRLGLGLVERRKHAAEHVLERQTMQTQGTISRSKKYHTMLPSKPPTLLTTSAPRPSPSLRCGPAALMRQTKSTKPIKAIKEAEKERLNEFFFWYRTLSVPRHWSRRRSKHDAMDVARTCMRCMWKWRVSGRPRQDCSRSAW